MEGLRKARKARKARKRDIDGERWVWWSGGMAAKNPDCDHKANLAIFAGILIVPLLVTYLAEPVRAAFAWLSQFTPLFKIIGAALLVCLAVIVGCAFLKKLGEWIEQFIEFLGRKSVMWWRDFVVSLQPSKNMNYRIFIPSLFGAVLLGALLHWGFAERYHLQALGGGVMIKTDRWSGNSWVLRGNGWYGVEQH